MNKAYKSAHSVNIVPWLKTILQLLQLAETIQYSVKEKRNISVRLGITLEVFKEGRPTNLYPKESLGSPLTE